MFFFYLDLVQFDHVCLINIGALTVCGNCCVTRHKVSQLAHSVSVSPAKGHVRTAARWESPSLVCVCVCI